MRRLGLILSQGIGKGRNGEEKDRDIRVWTEKRAVVRALGRFSSSQQ